MTKTLEEMESITISPAYGRDYKSGEAAIKDFKAGKDFVLRSVFAAGCGRYCSVRDFTPGQVAVIRYKRLQDAVPYTVGGDDVK